MSTRRSRWWFLLAAGCACQASEQMGHEELALEVGRGIVAACPLAAPEDEEARNRCAAGLTAHALLRDTMDEPFAWGGQRPGAGYRIVDSDTTRFNALVFRRMYLSLFMFTGEVRVESTGEALVIHLPCRFRNRLDPGSYPYPFWHSRTKWDSWQLAPELLLIMEAGRLKGALRSSARPDERERRAGYVERSWAGQWRWQKGGQEMPYVTLYQYLLSPENPHVAELDAAYRALEGVLRSESCLICHSPDNFARVGSLEFFNYPNQALFSRHSIVVHLAKNTMPPADNPFGFPAGIPDASTRSHLLRLAREFERVGDAALAFEGELKPWVPSATLLQTPPVPAPTRNPPQR